MKLIMIRHGESEADIKYPLPKGVRKPHHTNANTESMMTEQSISCGDTSIHKFMLSEDKCHIEYINRLAHLDDLERLLMFHRTVPV